MDQQDKIQMQLPADPAYVAVAAKSSEIFSLKRGFDQKTARQISLALEEAILNALEMGYRGIKNELEIHITRTTTGLKLLVVSLGLPLNPEQLPQYSPDKAANRFDTSGLSFFMVKQLMDEVSFSTLASGQRQLSLLKHLPLPIAPPPEIPVSEKTGGTEVTDSDLSWNVRMARPDDAEDISRLVIRAHGQVLFSEDIYYPARVEEMLRSRKMTSAVAVTEKGTILGHAALIPTDSQGKILEMTYGFVNPDFRSRGTVSEISRFLIHSARQSKAVALIVMAVTNHVISQKAAARVGFKECALLVATSSASAGMEAGRKTEVGRIGNLIQVRYLDDTAPLRLYLPKEHSTMVQKIYRHLGRQLIPEPLPEAGKNPLGPSEIWSESDLVEGWMLICVNSVGNDARERVNQHLQEALSHQIPAIQLLLPLDDPYTPAFTPIFEAAGFFFAGAGPGEGAREYLILQHLNTPNPGWENIHVLDGMGKEIRDYVLHCCRNR